MNSWESILQRIVGAGQASVSEWQGEGDRS
jgi:hypothetical protein